VFFGGRGVAYANSFLSKQGFVSHLEQTGICEGREGGQQTAKGGDVA